jgi:hypothetical protein
MQDYRNFIQAELENKLRQARHTGDSHQSAVQHAIIEGINAIRNNNNKRNRKPQK